MSSDKLTASASLKFDNLLKLSGQSNYILWSNAWRIAFKACQWWNIVYGNIVRPRSITDPTGKETGEESSTTSTATLTSQISEDIHSRLLDLNANHSLGNKGEKAYRVEKSGKNKGPKECTWCKKRNFHAKGHTWQECNKLKASKMNDKSAKEDEKVRLASQEVTTENSSTFAPAFVVSTNLIPSNASDAWIFDTGCASHMTHDADMLDSHRSHGGFIKFANGSKGEISGIGIVKLRCRLPGGQEGLAILNDVLLVPCLRQNLFSWKSVAKRGFSMIGKDEDIKLQDREGKDVLWAKEVSGSHVIQLEEDIARFSSYEVWHQALGHPSVLNNAEIDNLYSDSCLIPKPPKNFHCHACALSKSIHHKPTEGTRHNNATRCFELIHTNLSGKFSVPSIGKRNLSWRKAAWFGRAVLARSRRRVDGMG